MGGNQVWSKLRVFTVTSVSVHHPSTASLSAFQQAGHIYLPVIKHSLSSKSATDVIILRRNVKYFMQM